MILFLLAWVLLVLPGGPSHETNCQDSQLTVVNECVNLDINQVEDLRLPSIPSRASSLERELTHWGTR